MHEFADLYGVDQRQTLQFFFSKLWGEVEKMGIRREEALYVATIFATYALTPRNEADIIAPVASLQEVFDTFIVPATAKIRGIHNATILEAAGSQLLFLLGFFRSQMERRRNLRWYDGIGSSFFYKASVLQPDRHRSAMLENVGRDFPIWTSACHNMSRKFRGEQPLGLKFD